MFCPGQKFNFRPRPGSVPANFLNFCPRPGSVPAKNFDFRPGPESVPGQNCKTRPQKAQLYKNKFARLSVKGSEITLVES